MTPIEKNVEDIRILVRSGDLSDSLHLRQLHKVCSGFFRELNENLEKCRVLVKNGSLQEARTLNNSFSVSLTRSAELLDVPEVKEFLEICREYGLDMPQFPDEGLLTILSVPVTSGEKHLHILLQDYRKIARTGSKKERIELLRKIVSKLPDSPRWRNDLLSAERARLQEIGKEAEALPENMGSLEAFEKLYRELLSPEWATAPKEDLLELVRAKLLPLQQEKLRKNMEEKLQFLQDLCIERDIVSLRKALEDWHLFCANPLVKLSTEQKQAEKDIEDFLARSEKEENGRKEHEKLVRYLEEKIAGNCTFAEISGEYSNLLLQLEEYPVSRNLLERLKNLEAENARNEHFRNVRRCFYGVGIAILTIVLIAILVVETQKYLAVKHNANNLSLLIRQEKYLEAANLYVSLRSSSPKIAENPRILALYNSAVRSHEEKKVKQKKREEEFGRLLKQIRKLASGDDVLDNAAVIDKSLEEARKIMDGQKQKELDSFRELETKIAGERTKLKQKRENEFLAYCRNEIRKYEAKVAAIEKADLKMLSLDVERAGRLLQQKMDLFPYVPPHLKKRETLAWQNFCRSFADAVEREKRRRLVKMPYDFETFLNGLEAIRYKDAALAGEYRHALDQAKSWRNLYETYLGNVPENTDEIGEMGIYKDGPLKNDLIRLVPKDRRSKGFASFFTQMQKLSSYYELVFACKNGEEYFFYSKNMPFYERLRRPARINISFDTLQKDSFHVFRFDPGAEEEPFALVEAPPSANYTLPARYVTLGGEKKLTLELLAKRCPGGMFAKSFQALGSDGPGVFLNLQKAILALQDPEMIRNAYLKELIFIAFLEEFCKMAPPFYQELEKILLQWKSYQVSRKRFWQTTYAYREYHRERDILTGMWQSAPLEAAFALGKLRRDFVCAFHARKLVPAAVVTSIGANRIKYHKFSVKAPEYYIWKNGKLYNVTENVSSGRSKGKFVQDLFPGQVLWCFGDGRKTMDFITAWKKKMLEKNARLDVTASICPADILL